MVCCKPKEITPSLKIPSYERSVNGKLFTILTQTINVLWCTCNYFYEVMHLVKCIFLKRVKESCCCWLLARRKIVNVLYLTLVMHVIIFIPFCLESSNQCQSGIIEYCHYYRAARKMRQLCFIFLWYSIFLKHFQSFVSNSIFIYHWRSRWKYPRLPEKVLFYLCVWIDKYTKFPLRKCLVKYWLLIYVWNIKPNNGLSITTKGFIPSHSFLTYKTLLH